jgi:Protein of unknown function (DUF4231)
MSSSDSQTSSASSSVLSELTSALNWYDERAKTNQLAYRFLRVASIVMAAAIPVLTTSGAPRLSTAIVGSAIVVNEGVQQVFRYHERYIAYRSAWNALDRELRLYQSLAKSYANNPQPVQTLAERFDQIVGEEHSRWAIEMNLSPTAAN